MSRATWYRWNKSSKASDRAGLEKEREVLKWRKALMNRRFEMAGDGNGGIIPYDSIKFGSHVQKRWLYSIINWND